MRHLITLACLIAALLAYAIGWGQGIAIFSVIGIIFEGIFWLRILRKDQPRSSTTQP